MINFATVIARHATRTPEAPALLDTGVHVTYRDLAHLAAAVGAQLRAQTPSGRAVVAVAENSWRFGVLYAAAMWAGLPFAPLNNRLTDGELAELLRLLECERPYTDPPRQIPGCSAVGLSEAVPADLLGRSDRPGAASAPEERDVGCNSILFTSGTSGLPKGVMLSHASVLASSANVLLHQELTAQDVVGIGLPLCHTAALHGQLTPTWYAGAAATVLGRWDVAGYATAVRGGQVTTLLLLPQQWSSLLEELEPTERPLLRLPLTAGSPLGVPLLDRFGERLGMLPGFIMGMTEVSPQAFFMSPEETAHHDGAVGRPTTWASVELRPPKDAELPLPEGYGEISYSGPLVCDGYFGNDAATAGAFDPDGLFRGGDVAFVDDAGFLHIVDRVKDVVRTGGETVYTGEVEGVLREHPAVRDVAVIGLPHRRWGEGVTAVVVPADDGPPSLESLQDFCKGRLAGYKKPVRIVVLRELPRSATGKVLKRELRHSISDSGSPDDTE